MSADAREVSAAICIAGIGVVIVVCGALCFRMMGLEHHPCCDSLPRSEIKCSCVSCECCKNCKGVCGP